MKFVRFFCFCAFVTLFFSCTNSLEENSASDLSYGSLSITSSDSRYVNPSSIKYACGYVSGKGIESGSEPKSSNVNVTEAKGSLTIEKIPVGNNRIITVTALDDSKAAIFGYEIRAITDIKAGANNVQVTWSSTALGNIFYKLHNSGYDISTITESQKESIQKAIDTTVSSYLINTDAIVNDFKGGGISALKDKINYKLETASLKVNYSKSDYKIQVCDPNSSLKEDCSSGENTLEKIAPGTWSVYIFDSNGSIIKSTKMNFMSGVENVLDLDVLSNSIILHAKGYTHIYAWKTGTEEKYAGSWPGTAMQKDSDGWYTYSLEGITSSSIIFNNNGSSQTSDMTREGGEWWYKDGNWYESNPDDGTAPSIGEITLPSGSLSGIAVLSVSVVDNQSLSRVEFYVDSKKVGSVLVSGTSAQANYNLDTEYLSNGEHKIYAIVYDASGNQTLSSEKTFTTENENSAPVAIISGPLKAALGKTATYSACQSYDKNGDALSYSWTVSGTTIESGEGTDTIVVNVPENEGSTFTVSVTVSDGTDSSTSETLNVSVVVRTSNDFREESIYFLMTARFYDGDSSNNRYCRADDESGNRENDDPPWRGDFKGLIEKLDYIKALGFSAIWITPPVQNRSDFDFHGYHAWNMNKIDARLESAGATYQDLIDVCHAKGIKVIQDIVLNHSCRYGLEDLFVPKYWGDRDNPDWGKDSTINYYDEYNPSFTYNGLDAEPNSGKYWYNGDLWQKEKPTLSWTTDITNSALNVWGVVLGTNNQGRKYYGCQWPNLGLFDPELYHQTWLGNWEDYTCQSGTIHEDCIDLNTESEKTRKYLIDAYSKYIAMGVDGFRIDTVKHVSRVMFNRYFIPAFQNAAKNAGNENFYMFGEVCTRVNEVWNHGVAPLSTPFYTWKERKEYSADDVLAASEGYEYENGKGTDGQPTSDNHELKNNTYRTPDYSMASGLNVIDFPMHWNFSDAGSAYNMRGNDKYYNDATWNVVYVDSHDYGPNMDNRYPGDENAWAQNMTLMWTFRGIPCLYYGSEIRFKAGADADKGAAAPLESTGRAYYGENIKGSITASDYGKYTSASGTVATTIEAPLSKHVRRLNVIRRAIPALQKGQYTNDGCSGSMAFKRRFTDESVDSFVLVTIGGNATFSKIPSGTYIDAVTGDSKTVSEGGTLSASCSGSGNARIYVLQTSSSEVTGAIGADIKDTFLK